MNAFRRIALQKLRDLAWRESWRRKNESMNVIFDTADLERGHLVLSCDAAYVRPDASFDCRYNPRLAVLGAEGKVIVERCVGIGHEGTPIVSFSRRYATMS